MKTVLVLFCITLILGACKKDTLCISGDGNLVTQERTVSPFNKIEANGSYTIYIKKDSEQRLRVEAESNLQNRIITRVSGDRLIIESEGCITRSKGVTIWISVPNFEGLTLNGSGNVSSENKLSGANPDIALNGSGNITLDVEANTSLKANISGSGDMKLSGSAPKENINISGSGNVKANDLPVQTADVNISGSGNAEVNVSNSLRVTISGSGSVYYTGTGSLSEVSISGSGSVKKR